MRLQEMEFETAVVKLSEELDEHSTPKQWCREDITFIDPAILLFEITFGCRLGMVKDTVNKPSVSSKGINPTLHIWM